MKPLIAALQRRIDTRTILVGLVIPIVLLGASTPTMAHSWQETIRDGDYELGTDSEPAEPAAGVPTEFTGHITNTTATEESDGIGNRTVVVTVTGPDGYHDRFETTMDPYIAFSYVFPTAGEYDFEMATTIDNEAVGFQFTRNVSAETETKHSDSDGTGIDENVLALGALSGAAAVFALGAFIAAVMAYRGTD